MTLQARMGVAGFDLETETPVVQCFDRQRSDEYGESDIASTMSARDYKDATDLVAQPIVQQMAVRRLTPRECERLQGFPDDYTAIPSAADGPRYKALGNSMAVPVMAWIGKRIQTQLLLI